MSPKPIQSNPQSVFFFDQQPTQHTVAISQEVTDLIAANCAVAFSVSGGKDGTAAAIAGVEYLNSVGHTGPRILIHADLGRVEWKDSLPSCERLAAKLGLELVVVRRQAGDMMDRWLGRWRNNVARYLNLECVKLILPWSTPSMRFCTSELKSKVMDSYLKKRFAGMDVLSVTGIRRQESSRRRTMPVSKAADTIVSKDRRGVTWNDVIEWPIEQVFAAIKQAGLDLHEAYTRYGVSRVSCCFCIMSSEADLIASASCIDNHAIYVEMVGLEVTSTFSFQEGKWLGDIAPHLLSEDLRARLAIAKANAKRREAAEARLPAQLLYESGWPTRLPTEAEAELIDEVRAEVAAAVGIPVARLGAQGVIARYEELMIEAATKAARDAEKATRAAIKQAKVQGKPAKKAPAAKKQKVQNGEQLSLVS